MFDYFTMNKAKSKITISYHKLSEVKEANLYHTYLEQAAIWANEKWGYIRNSLEQKKKNSVAKETVIEETTAEKDKRRLNARKKLIAEFENNFYIATYENIPIGMFGFKDYPIKTENKDTKPEDKFAEAFKKNPGTTKELVYVYVDQSFRNLGIGTSIIKKAKEICSNANVKHIVFDTLNPNLNRFYEKLGALEVCESNLFSFPTTWMKMPIEQPEEEKFISSSPLVSFSTFSSSQTSTTASTASNNKQEKDTKTASGNDFSFQMIKPS